MLFWMMKSWSDMGSEPLRPPAEFIAQLNRKLLVEQAYSPLSSM